MKISFSRELAGQSEAWHRWRRAMACDSCGQRRGRWLHLCGELGRKDGRVTRWHWNLG